MPSRLRRPSERLARRVGAAVVGLAALATVTAVAGGGAADAAPTTSTEISGYVMEGHGDVFDQDRKVPGYHVHAADGRTLQLDGVDARTAASLVGRQVRFKGNARGNRVQVEAGTLAADGTTTSSGTTLQTALAAGTPRTVAVLLVNFADNPVQPWTTTQVRSAYFDATTSANAYFQDASDGRIAFSGDVFGWFTITRASTSSCDWSAWGSAASSAATSAGVNLSAYQHVSYVWPSAPCGWSGLGYLPGTATYLNGTISSSVISHELGHNLGVHHASALSCKDPAGTPVPISSSCTLSEYGDPFNVMGSSGGYRLLHGFHRAQLGWLPEVQTVTSAATVTIAPVDTPGTTRLVRIPRGDGTFLDLDFRQPAGLFDAFAAGAAVTSGVTLRIDPGLTTRSQSQLVDVTPTATASFSDSSLKLGQAFTDPVSSATIQVTAVTSTGATVQIGFGPDTIAPSSPTNLKATVTGSSVALAWTASTDNRGVTGYVVRRNGLVFTTVTGTSFTDTAAPVGTTATYAVSAVDAAGNESAQATVSVTIPTPDTTAPTSPTGLTASVSRNGTVSLAWRASTDDRGVVGYDVARTGRTFTVTGTTATDRPGAGTWSYTVMAKDAAGNRSAPASVTVTVR